MAKGTISRRVNREDIQNRKEDKGHSKRKKREAIKTKR
jgi:hypothetical protein